MNRWEPTPELLEDAMSVGVAHGAAEVEIYAERSHSREAKVYRQSVENLESSETVGLGIRAIVRGRAGYAYTSDPEELGATVAKAVENAEVGTEDEYNVLPDAATYDAIEGIYSDKVETTSMEAKIDMALSSEAAATGCDARIKPYTATYSENTQDVWIYNSRGLRAAYRVGYSYIYVSVVAEQDGEAQTSWAFKAGRAPSELSPEEIGVEAAERALSLLGARKLASCEAQVVMQPLVASQFVGLLGQALTADSVQRGRSLFADKVGEAVASPMVNVIDDGRLPGGFASAPVDDEGVPTGRTSLIDQGVLTGFLHNTYTAARAKVRSTGNARRGSFKSLPGVSPSNLFVEGGTTPVEDLIAGVDRGMIVYEVSGMHAGANPISGEVSLGATGLWIEKGKVAHPVREVTIGGHILDILKDISGLGDDFQLVPMAGSTGAPSILISSMTIGGT